MGDRTAGKRGRLPSQKLDMGTLHDYMRSNIPTPPTAVDYSPRVKSYPMALNDEYGDCTIAGAIHMLQLQYAEVGEDFKYPGDEAVKEEYFKLTGGADGGLVEASVLQTWMSQGIFGNKISAFSPVNIKNRQEMTAAIYLFGSVYLGVNLPGNAEEQFENHKPWTVSVPQEAPVGGHCVIATGYNNLGIDLITWGAVQSATWEWWEAYGEEAWVVIPEVFTEIDHGPVWAIDIIALQEDIKNLDK
jgi:hypothetical protein